MNLHDPHKHVRLGNYKFRTLAGFTLIELLIVIAVIAVLVAFAFPMLSKMSTQSSLSKASSNFRQLGSVLAIYAADNDQNLPLLQTNHRSYYRNIYKQIGSELYRQMGLPEPTKNFQPVPLLIVPALKKWLFNTLQLILTAVHTRPSTRSLSPMGQKNFLLAVQKIPP